MTEQPNSIDVGRDLVKLSGDGARLAKEFVDVALERGLTLATAESLTGGLISATLVAVPGVSNVLWGGVTAYDTSLKHSLLGVDAAFLQEHGPIDPNVAAMMAEGVRRACAKDGVQPSIGLATTGVAGPDSQDGHPVGEVYVAVSSPQFSQVERFQFQGDRTLIRLSAVAAALRMALQAALAN